MAKEDQDFSKVESKFKLSLLQVERRFVDLETVVSEVSEKLKDVDLTPVNELKQRIDDIEDLIMVEQAAIIELKNMLENMPKPEAPAVDLSGVESKIAELQQKTATPVEKVDMQPVMDQINALKQQVDQKVQEFSAKVPSLDVEVFSSKYDALQKGINDVQNKKVELDLKIEGVKKSIEIVERKIGEMATERIAEEIQNNKKDVILINAKMETIEKIVKTINEDMQNVQASVGKLDSFEKLTLLGREIESKIERFKIIEDELRRLSSRMEMLYSNMDKRIEGATQSEKKIPEVFDSINNLKRELDKQRLEILDRVKKEDVKDLTKGLEQEAQKVSAALEKEYNEFLKRVSKINAVDKKELETTRNNLAVRIDNLRVDLQKTNGNLLNSLHKEISNKLDVVQTKDFIRKNDLQYLYKSVKDLDGKLNEVNNKMRKVNVDDVLKMMEVFKKDVDDRLNSLKGNEDSLVDEVVRHAELGFDEMDYRIQTLLDKIVYLETRMAAMEKMLEDTRMPVIIE